MPNSSLVLRVFSLNEADPIPIATHEVGDFGCCGIHLHEPLPLDGPKLGDKDLDKPSFFGREPSDTSWVDDER